MRNIKTPRNAGVLSSALFTSLLLMLPGSSFAKTITATPPVVVQKSPITKPRQNQQPGGVAPAHAQTAVELFKSGVFKKAKLAFEAQLKDDNKNGVARSYLAILTMRDDDLDQAEDLMDEALKQAADNAGVQFRSGEVYSAVAQDSSIFTALGHAKDALNGFRRATELEPGNVTYRMALLQFYNGAPGIAGGDTDKAMAQAVAIAKLDTSAGVQAKYIVLANTKRLKQANTLLNNALRENPDDLELLFLRGIRQQQTKQFEKARADFKHLIAVSKDDPKQAKTTYGALYQLGRTAVLSKKHVDEGMSALQNYIKDAPRATGLPGSDWAQFRRANLIEIKGDASKADDIYRTIAKNTKDKNLRKEAQKKI